MTKSKGEWVPLAFDEDAALTLAERTFSTEVVEQLAEDVIRYAQRLHTLYTTKSLQHIQAEAVEEFIDKQFRYRQDVDEIELWKIIRSGEHYANRLRQQQTNEEHHIYPKGELLSNKTFTIHTDYNPKGDDDE